MTNTSIITKEVKIPAFDGGAFNAYVAKPANADKDNSYPAIVMIQEIFGVNQEMRNKCEEYAKLGYITICPDLFWRIEPNIQLVDSVEEELKRAFELYQEFDIPLGIEDLKTTVGYIKNNPACNNKIGAIGYCLGGYLSYQLAAAADLNAAVSYYGVSIDEHLNELDNIKEPLLLHIAGEDQFVNKDAQKKIRSTIESYSHITAFTYEGLNHAFARKDGIDYDKDAATLANSRTFEFLKTHLT